MPSLALFLLVVAGIGEETDTSSKLRFHRHFIDRDMPGSGWGQTSLVDLDRDGDLDFITGRSRGELVWYEYRPGQPWKKHPLGGASPSDVGGVAIDVDGDGWTDQVAGGAWYRNPGNPRESAFERNVFDSKLAAVHDIVSGDIDGDGRADVVTMSDRNDLRWYRIPGTPAGVRSAWTVTRIGPSTHSGISLGDLDRDGDLDVVRSDLWFENSEGGRKWSAHRMTEPWGATARAWQRNATRTQPADINRDGRLDVVISDGEMRGGRIGWVEAPEDPKTGEWTLHLLPTGDATPRGAYHSLAVVDFDGDDDLDIFSCEMEHVRGDRQPRWYVWENLDGRGGRFAERVILDEGLGGHECVVGDVDGDGDIDIVSKLWRPREDNANDGRAHALFLENLLRSEKKRSGEK